MISRTLIPPVMIPITLAELVAQNHSIKNELAKTHLQLAQMTELVEALTKELQKQRLKDVDLPRFLTWYKADVK